MSTLRTRDTEPELALRRELHRRGLRYRVSVTDLPGRPDIALTRAKIAVFVDGCFWHSCTRHAVAPKSNARWWRDKLQSNVDRDRRNDSALRSIGWLVIRVWEHEDPREAATTIEQSWNRRTGRRHH